MKYEEYNKRTDCLFEDNKKIWETDKRFRYIWGHVVTFNGQIKFYTDLNNNIVSEIEFKETTIHGIRGKLWYVDNVLVGFTRDTDNKYCTCLGLGVRNDTDGDYWIKGISESLKILQEEAEAKKIEAANFWSAITI